MLYLVPTPLGNLEDITRRAERVLREVQAVYCEDTRRTRILLTHLGLSTTCLRYDDHNPHTVKQILERLRSGHSLALVSDSGTPVISDPGYKLVSQAREEGLPVTSLPGPSAVAAAVAGSGFPGDSFVFLGFLPRSDGKRRRALEEASKLEKTIVLYESPHRILDLLEMIGEVLGPQTRICAARELSKVYEEWLTGTPEETAAKLKSRDKIQGEFVVLIGPPHGKDHSNPTELETLDPRH